MNRKDVQLLILVLGILVAVLSWQFVYNPNQEKVEQVSAENATLRTTISELEALNDNKEQYLADIETMTQECDEITNRFPSGFLLEDEVMYLYNMENVTQNQVVIPSIGFGQTTEVPYTGVTTVGEYELVDEGIKLYTAQDNISFTTTYSGLKNMVQYIYDIPGRKSISSVSLSASSDGYLSGSMSVDFYCMTGTEKLYVPIDIPGVVLGKSNIFGVLDETGNTDENEPNAEEENTEE